MQTNTTRVTRNSIVGLSAWLAGGVTYCSTPSLNWSSAFRWNCCTVLVRPPSSTSPAYSQVLSQSVVTPNGNKRLVES